MASPPIAVPEPAPKRKRGRPRKYAPPEDISGLTLSGTSPPSPAAVSAAAAAALRPIAPKPSPQHIPPEKRGRGRPPGSGKKSQHPRPLFMDLAKATAASAVGQVVQTGADAGVTGAGTGGASGGGAAAASFSPRVLTVPTGEDVAGKVLGFSQQGPRAVCVLSANGAVSSVTLRHDSAFGGNSTYEGRFEILSLSGSFLYSEAGGTRSRSGGLSVSLSAADGKVVGGSVSGLLVAASPVQIVVGSFIPDA